MSAAWHMLETLMRLMFRLGDRAPIVFIICFGAWPALGILLLLRAEPDPRAVQAAESGARAQWAEVYWERRQARALEAACDPRTESDDR